MASISECPVTEMAWNQRSVDKGCSPQNNYHCVRTQDDGILELCTNPIWIQAGKCPVYNEAGKLDSSYCQPRQLFKCPTNVYRSNQVFSYPSCFPEKRELTTDNSQPTSSFQPNTTLDHVSDDNGGNNSALAALILILPIVLAIVIFWKRRQIRQWIQNLNTRRHIGNDNKDSTGSTPVNETGQTSDDMEQGNREMDTLLTKDITCEENQNIQPELEVTSGHVGGPTITNVENVQPIERKVSLAETVPSASTTTQGLKNTRNLIPLDFPKFSFLDKITKEFASKELVIITGLPGSGKTELAYQVVTSTSQIFTKGANFRPIDDLSILDSLDIDKTTLILLDHCIKGWFSKTVIDNTVRQLKTAIKKGNDKVHALLCVPDSIFEVFNLSLKSNFFEHGICDLRDRKIYKDEDWKAIFDFHLWSKKEMFKKLNYKRSDIDVWRKKYIKSQATRIGKPTMAKLLFEDATNLQNVPKFLKNPYASLLQRISALSESNGESERRHFAVLVALMLNNGKASIANLKKGILTDICKSFNVEDTSLFEHVDYVELERNAEIVSVRCRETVLVTFDVLWKKRKDLVIKYCDEELFLERVSLTKEIAEQELIALNERFQSIISTGKSFVKDHAIVAKCSWEIEHKMKQKTKLNV